MSQSLLNHAPEVHPELDKSLLTGLLVPERLLWTPNELLVLTKSIATDLASELVRISRFDQEQRWWARLGLTEGVELWLLSWLPGQHTKPHDHGGAAGAFSVFQGQLFEEYRYPNGPVRSRTHHAGNGIGFGAGRAHQVFGTGDTPSVSVHAYSPPLVPTREYASLADIPGEIPALTAAT